MQACMRLIPFFILIDSFFDLYRRCGSAVQQAVGAFQGVLCLRVQVRESRSGAGCLR